MPTASPSSTSTVSDTDQELYELSITRVFDAPRDLVFEAFSNPEHTKQWMGPRSFIATHLDQDARRGLIDDWAKPVNRVV
jgi:uncharacterized protein YndB with AHSA1/START domain